MANDPTLDKDNLHRGDLFSLKRDPDMTPGRAEAWRSGLKFAVVIDDADTGTYGGQMCLLTAINLAWRVSGQFGSVTVHGVSPRPCDPMIAEDKTLPDYITETGGICLDTAPEDDRLVILIGAAAFSGGRFRIRAAFSDWTGGIMPEDRTPALPVDVRLPLGPALAASIAVWECFRFHDNHGSAVGRRTTGIDLWTMQPNNLETLSDDTGDAILLPDRIWCLGLGHLGQAYFWLIGHLPYSAAERTAMSLKVQDHDVVSTSNLSTSVLSVHGNVGVPKTEACSSWLLSRGFSPHMISDAFDPGTKLDFGSDAVLGGVDNLETRRGIMAKNPAFYIDAGLGETIHDFQTMRIIVPSTDRSPTDVWPIGSNDNATDLDGAIRRLRDANKLDQCGAETLNGTAVGFPFVGMVAATVVLTQLISHWNDGQVFEKVDIDLLESKPRI